MLIRLGYEMEFELPAPTPVVLMLYTHPERAQSMVQPDRIQTDPWLPIEEYFDSYGNRCGRIYAPAGRLRIWNDALVADSGQPDPIREDARQLPVQELPPEVLQYLMASRYCEVDLLSELAWQLFGNTPSGWRRVQSICSWVHSSVQFGYHHARATKSAREVLEEHTGVCRDFQHLAITFCRCLNIPARYATGYLGDIGVPAQPDPMDFSAWFEAYLDGEWWPFDARHNTPRIGRVLMATGRDATDVALTTSFGRMDLLSFRVWTDEVAEPQLLRAA